MVRTVKQVTGLPIHHYIEVDFVGFQSLVDDIGGVYLDFPYPARDANSGLSVDAGYQLLDGSQALAYAQIASLSGATGRQMGLGRRRRHRSHRAPTEPDSRHPGSGQDPFQHHRGRFHRWRLLPST